MWAQGTDGVRVQRGHRRGGAGAFLGDRGPGREAWVGPQGTGEQRGGGERAPGQCAGERMQQLGLAGRGASLGGPSHTPREVPPATRSRVRHAPSLGGGGAPRAEVGGRGAGAARGRAGESNWAPSRAGGPRGGGRERGRRGAGPVARGRGLLLGLAQETGPRGRSYWLPLRLFTPGGGA